LAGGTGNPNAAYGSNAGRDVTGNGNTALGQEAGRNVQGDSNLAMGQNVQGSNNMALGSYSGYGVTGEGNAALGLGAGRDVTGDNNIAHGAGAGGGVQGNDNVSIGSGAGRGTVADRSVAVGAGAVAGTDGVALGSGAKAVQGSVALGAGSQAVRGASQEYVAYGLDGVHRSQGEVNLGGRQLTGLAPGSEETDAVNVAQLRAASQAAETRFGESVRRLDRDLQSQERKLSAGVAAAMATAALPQAYLPGRNMVSLAGGTWNGESGYALGISRVSESGTWVYKVNANGTSRGDLGAAAGVGYQW
jgi:hypothetical protein